MKLSAIIRDYRHRMHLSQRKFSEKCGLSNTYISFLENEMNPKTGRPIIPTLEQYGKLAAGMDMTVHQLFEQLDEDAPVDLSFTDSPHVVIENMDQFSHLLQYMPREDYDYVIAAFDRAYKKIKEKGYEL